MESQYDKGLALRRKAMGDDYVSKSLANATGFTQRRSDRRAQALVV